MILLAIDKKLEELGITRYELAKRTAEIQSAVL